ncbi:MAG TPA: dethiobiotin synthase [Polyangiaceae bacterium]|nr:dethiobiotin synthase [Polyangiaceae bacterium]
MPRVVVLGTGTGVGKTHVSCQLCSALAALRPAARVAGLKPVETGFVEPSVSDARRLEAHARDSSPPRPHPFLAFPEPISPHLAARRARHPLALAPIVEWVERWEAASPEGDERWCVVETAGGAFSPLAPGLSNVELARALDPAVWLLVAPDALGVLHDVSATLRALAALGRSPDLVVLSAARGRDASTGTNAAELRALGLADPIAVFDDGPSETAARALAAALLRHAATAQPTP